MNGESKIYPRGILRGPEATLGERVLSLLFRREEIPTRMAPHRLYMRRFFVIPAISWLGVWQRCIHVFHRSDLDPDPHDHPHKFRTRILWGGYLNETWEVWTGYRVHVGTSAMLPGMMACHRATHVHRVRLLDEESTTWTFVARGPKERDWGFWTVDGFVPNETYLRRQRS